LPAQIGAPGALRFSDKESLLMARWRNPTLSIHGIEGAFSGAGAKTVIPRSVIGAWRRRAPDTLLVLVLYRFLRREATLATLFGRTTPRHCHPLGPHPASPRPQASSRCAWCRT
jgi:hypothetical protein